MPKNHRNYQKTRHIALSGLLFALAMALSFIEGTLVIPGLLPGMKLGLANIVVMYALFFMGARQALVLDVLKALFVFLVSGFTAGFLSLCGGLLSLAVMWVLYYLLPVRPTWFILSVCGALAHNVGQLLGAGVIISSSLSLYYAPVMLVLGLVMGALTSVTLRALLPALGRLHDERSGRRVGFCARVHARLRRPLLRLRVSQKAVKKQKGCIERCILFVLCREFNLRCRHPRP